MKHKADIGRCTIAKHTVEVEPGAVPHREGARRMSPEKAERANQEVRNLLALGMIRPSLSPWASGIVMVKKRGVTLLLRLPPVKRGNHQRCLPFASHR